MGVGEAHQRKELLELLLELGSDLVGVMVRVRIRVRARVRLRVRLRVRVKVRVSATETEPMMARFCGVPFAWLGLGLTRR